MRDVLAWLEQTARLRATSVGDVPGGFVVRNRDYPAAHDHNLLIINSAVDPDALAIAADEALADASHRLIYVHDPGVADAVTPRLTELGYERSDELILVAESVGGPRNADTAEVRIVELDVDERIAVATEEWRADKSADVARQLGERIRTVLPAADVTFLAVRSDDETVVAHVDLYVRDGLAQVEELMTAPAARGRGYGSALVIEAVRRARANRAFIVADVDDWPKQLYRRLGFRDLGTTATFSRA